ncbi:MAG: ABC transporter substrate-binding protein [Dermatophilus congolensis]|nr:ABC transporter substrate-binding protein [Dermatophilus congolensis]
MSHTFTNRFGRRTIAGAAVAFLALGLAACGTTESGSGQTGAGTTLTVGTAPSLSGLGVHGAVAGGEFTKQGLTVNAVPNKSANDTVPQLLNGQVQIAMMDTVTFMQARGQGLPVKIVAPAGLQSTDGGAGVMSAASIVAVDGSNIDAPAGLVGKKVAVAGIKTQTWMNIRAIVDAAGGDSSKIEFVEVPPAQMVDLLKRGEVNAAVPNEPLASQAIANSGVHLVHNTDVPGNKGVPSSVYVASEQFIAGNADTIDKFAKAMFASAAKVNSDKAFAAKVAEEQLKFTPDKLTHAFYQTQGSEAINPADLDKVASLAVKYQILPSAPTTADLLHQGSGK